MYEFTKNEIRDLLIAFAVLSISFAICNVGTDPFGIASILPIVMIGVGAGFLLHEIGRQNCNCRANDQYGTCISVHNYCCLDISFFNPLTNSSFNIFNLYCRVLCKQLFGSI